MSLHSDPLTTGSAQLSTGLTTADPVVAGARILGSDAARAVGRFNPNGPIGYRAKSLPDGPVRATRAEAEQDEARLWAAIDARLQCRCIWRGERCRNRATEEDGLCNWCCRTQRSVHRLRQDPRAVVVSDTEVSIGGAGQTHDFDVDKPASTAACWYPDSDRTVLGASR